MMLPTVVTPRARPREEVEQVTQTEGDMSIGLAQGLGTASRSMSTFLGSCHI